MEGGAEALITSSGNAAILCAVTAALEGRAGPLVTHHDVYGGTAELLGIRSSVHRVPVEIVDSTNAAAWYCAVSRAGAVLLKTPSNPLMRLIDLKQTVVRAQPCGAPVIVDNTVATPFKQRPFDFGVDWIVHSMSKYLNGHSDMIGGCLVRTGRLSPRHRTIHKNLAGVVGDGVLRSVVRICRLEPLKSAAGNSV